MAASAARYGYSYNEYPTPPRTSSPKHTGNSNPSYNNSNNNNNRSSPRNQRSSSPSHAFPDTNNWAASTSATPYDKNQNASYYASANAGNPATATPTAARTGEYEYFPAARRPSEIEYHSHSQSNSQSQYRPQQHPSQTYIVPPPTTTNTANTNRTSALSPSRKRWSPSPSSRPFYASPSNPLPTPFPYSTARPKPRPGLLRRLKAKIVACLRACMKWCRRHPVAAGLLTFVPMLAGAGLLRLGVVSGLVPLLKKASPRSLFERAGGGQQGNGKKGEKGEGKWDDDGMGQFAGFAGSKGGPLEGIFRILQMGV